MMTVRPTARRVVRDRSPLMAASTTPTSNRASAPPQIAICSLAGDLHALRVWEALVTRFGAVCHLVETDRLASRPLRWDITQLENTALPALGGTARVTD